MHVTIARTPAAVMTRRAVPARRRTRTAPVVVAASSPEGVPKMAPDERRRAPAAVATAAAAIVASTVVSPLAAHRYARTGSRPDAEPRSHRSNHNPRKDRFCHVCNRVCVPIADEIIEPAPLSLGIPPIIVQQRGPHLGVQRERHRLQGRRAG